jgi:thioredoxin reductase (NADPH)
VKSVRGGDQLAGVDIVNRKTGEERTLPVAALFSFIGAVPRTEWLRDTLVTDEHGFIATGPSAGPPSSDAKRDRFVLETSRSGVFAAGDVRSGSIKRVASAVGEGAMAVKLVHEYFKET